MTANKSAEKKNSYSAVRYQKPNMMIDLLYSSNILDSQIMALALVKIQKGVFEDMQDGSVCVEFTTHELLDILGLKNNTKVYEKLSMSAWRLLHKVYMKKDDRDQNFAGFTVFSMIYYRNGIYHMEFSSVMSSILRHIQNRYTVFPLETMLRFNSVAAFRLYEQFKSHCYNSADNRYSLTFTVSQLRIMLGTVSFDSLNINTVNRYKKDESYDELVSYAMKKGAALYPRNAMFFSRCLYPAIEEVNAITDMNIKYTAKHSDRKAVSAFIFDICYKKKHTDSADSNNDSERDAVCLVMRLFPEMSQKDARAVADVAADDTARISNAYACYVQHKSDIQNPAAWMIAAIKGNYIPGEVSKKKGFDQGIETNDYDMDRITRAMFSRTSF